MNKQKTLLYIRRTSFALYAILVVIMAIATIVENYYGSDFAHQHIYEAWWFIALWIAALLTTLPCVPRHIQGIWRQLHHQRTAATALLLFATTALTATEVRVTERAQQIHSAPCRSSTTTESAPSTPLPATSSSNSPASPPSKDSPPSRYSSPGHNIPKTGKTLR